MTAPIIRNVPFNSSTWTSSSSIRSAIASVVWSELVSPTAAAFRFGVDVPRPPGGRNVARGCDSSLAVRALFAAVFSVLIAAGCGASDEGPQASPWAEFCAAWHAADLDQATDAILDGDLSELETLRSASDVGELAPAESTRGAWVALADGADDNATLLAVINPAVANCR